jgi:hypothetical protein
VIADFLAPGSPLLKIDTLSFNSKYGGARILGRWTWQTLLDDEWEVLFEGPTKTARRGGRFQPYLPDTLADRPLMIDAELARHAHEVEARVRQLATSPRSRSLEGLARFLLRSEALASSKIEGLQGVGAAGCPG